MALLPPKAGELRERLPVSPQAIVNIVTSGTSPPPVQAGKHAFRR